MSGEKRVEQMASKGAKKTYRVTLDVTETIQHSAEIEVDRETLEALQAMDFRANDIAGNFCSRGTEQNGEWELNDVLVHKPTAPGKPVAVSPGGSTSSRAGTKGGAE